MDWAQLTNKRGTWLSVGDLQRSDATPGKAQRNEHKRAISGFAQNTFQPLRDDTTNLSDRGRLRSASVPHDFAPAMSPPSIVGAPEEETGYVVWTATVHRSSPVSNAPSNTGREDVAAPLHALDSRPTTPLTLSRNPMPQRDRDINARRAHKFARLITKILQMRTQVDYQQQSLSRKLDLLYESIQGITNASNSSDADSLETVQLQSLSKFREQYRTDCDAVEAQRETLREAQSGLTVLEFRLAGKEVDLADTLTAVGANLPDDTGDAVSSNNDAEEKVTHDTPPLLRQFYDRKGDERIYQERLHVHEDTYREGVAQRELLADRDDPLPTTDEEFELEYQTQLDIILADLHLAQADVAQLTRDCEAAGFGTEVRRNLARHHIMSTPYSADQDPFPPPVVRGDFLQAVDGFLPANPSHQFDQRSNGIQGWLASVDADQNESQLPSPTLEELTPRHDRDLSREHEGSGPSTPAHFAVDTLAIPQDEPTLLPITEAEIMPSAATAQEVVEGA
ncbi:hypothetical protein LTR17_013121 [Elasticomyces elasticus]|nr:hypothetical protein LTR17_013121 [Elasticomyces elasticus]